VRVSACSLTLPSPGGTVRGTHSLEKVPSSVSYRCERGGGIYFCFASATPARFHSSTPLIGRFTEWGKKQITLTLQFGEQQNQTLVSCERIRDARPTPQRTSFWLGCPEGVMAGSAGEKAREMPSLTSSGWSGTLASLSIVTSNSAATRKTASRGCARSLWLPLKKERPSFYCQCSLLPIVPWRCAVWIEIGHEKVAKDLITASELVRRNDAEQAYKHSSMPYIEAGHIDDVYASGQASFRREF